MINWRLNHRIILVGRNLWRSPKSPLKTKRASLDIGSGCSAWLTAGRMARGFHQGQGVILGQLTLKHQEQKGLEIFLNKELVSMPLSEITQVATSLGVPSQGLGNPPINLFSFLNIICLVSFLKSHKKILTML